MKQIIAVLDTVPQSEVPMNAFGTALQGTVQVVMKITAKQKHNAYNHGQSIKRIAMLKQQFKVRPEDLAKMWGIGLPAAKWMLEATTQHGLRTILHPTLSRQFWMNDHQLRYQRLAHKMFTDMLEANTVSWYQQNRYAQVFATKFGWVQVFPMKKKSDAHEGLSLMAQRDGVPPAIVMDGSKEQTMGMFRKKARQMDCHIKQTEPYLPWQNVAEGAIREVQRAAGCKMAKAKSPAKLWDHCLELKGYIKLNTVIDNYELQGQVPETILSGQTSDISPFVECAWYEWVYWYNNLAKYPELREELGRWLGPALDIGPAMTAKILKSNGQMVYLSMYRKLMDDKMQDRDEQKKRDEFDACIQKQLSKPLSPDAMRDLGGDVMTPEYELYEDNFEGAKDNIPDIDDVTPEDEDNYVGAEVNLPIGGMMKAGKVKQHAQNASGEVTGVKNDNPILDRRIYEVEFSDGEVAEYSANQIAENMFAQCDPDGNQHLLMEAIVDHKSNGTAVQFADRFVTMRG